MKAPHRYLLLDRLKLLLLHLQKLHRFGVLLASLELHFGDLAGASSELGQRGLEAGDLLAVRPVGILASRLLGLPAELLIGLKNVFIHFI